MSVEAAQHHAQAQAAQAEQGLKELSNWITLVSENWHGRPWADFLHRWENVVFAWTVGLILILLAFLGTRKKKEIPGPFQNFLEAVAEGLENFFTEVLGKRGKKHIPFVGTLFLYILCQNLFGLVPAMKSPTSNLNTTVALAVTVFCYVQGTALMENGILGYIDHLMGSPRDPIGWIMVTLNFPLHILEELIKPLSLSLRLFGNILGEDSLIAAFVTLGIAALAFFHIPAGLPLQFPFMLLALLTGTIQALVFSLLSTIYISLMLPHPEEEHP